MDTGYECGCPVCGKVHVVARALIQPNQREVEGADGQIRPAFSCGAHTSKEVHLAYSSLPAFHIPKQGRLDLE